MSDLGKSTSGLSVGYIVSLPHSGSTILGYNLSEHPDIIFLGEVGYALTDLAGSISKGTRLSCSCNQFADQCEFWSKVTARIDECRDQNSGYRVVLEEFQKNYGTKKRLSIPTKPLSQLFFWHHSKTLG